LSLFLCFLYVVWRFVVPLPWSATNRGLLALALLLVSKHHLIQIWMFGTMFSPEVPRLVVLLFGVLFCAFVLLTLLLLAVDVIQLVCRLVRGGRAFSRATRARVRYGVATLSLVLACVGVYQAIKVPQVRRIE